MREFLRDPWFWIRETIRWHWLDVLSAVTLTLLAISFVAWLLRNA